MKYFKIGEQKMADILYTYKIRYTQTLQINATADAPSASEVTKTVSVMPRHSGTKNESDTGRD